MKLNHFIAFFIFFQIGVLSQEIPPIEIFKPKDYGAEDQNWSISQSDDRSIYFANNKGLLGYNGAKWNLYKSPNSSIVRSVKIIDDKIYTGSYKDFGYWTKDDFGVLEYTSIAQNNPISLAEDEEFWNILELDRWVLFQSLDRIYIYDTRLNTIDFIESETTIIKMYKVENDIYYQKFNQGIYKLLNGQEELITNDEVLKDKIIINIFSENGQLLFQTKEHGFYMITRNNSVINWDYRLNKKLRDYSIYNSIKLKNGDFILGTVSNGIIYLNSKKEIDFSINQSKGLANNTVLSLFEDEKGNVWLGHDNGISNINFNAPFRVFKDDLGVLGSVYTTFLEDDLLYLGTNQGLFYKNQNEDNGFQFIEGTEGQVWSLQKKKNTLFCGHDKGTFIISEGKAEKIANTFGTWLLKNIDDHPNLLIQGSYNGLYILQKINGNWQLRNKIKGFDVSSRHLEFVSENHLLVSHEQKGVFRLEIDSLYRNVISFSKTSVSKSIKSSLTMYNDKILYSSNVGVFVYDKASLEFKKDSTLSNLYDITGYISGNLIRTNNKLFSFTNDDISYIQKGKLSSNYELFSIPIPNSIRETKEGYENILHIGKKKYLLGTTNGYLIIDLSPIKKIPLQIRLNGVSANSLTGEQKSLPISNTVTLENEENHIKISYSVTDYNKYFPSLYQYRLIGSNNNWSDWSEKSDVYFENLPYGNYTFEAKAKLGNQETSNHIRYNFVISKPTYLKPFALIFYFISSIFIIIITHLLYRNYYKKQREKLLKQKEKELEIKQLENEQQLMHFKNLDLQKDIDSKNRELGLSTMNLIKRNELLGRIKKELGSVKRQEDVKNVITLINNNLNTSDDWKLFEEAFKNTDKGFIKKLKSQHTNLTSNDLRLCTYLRLNLSSKEIAPLLNISIRSVEVKRYRLRKKMNLPHEASLSSYILNI